MGDAPEERRREPRFPTAIDVDLSSAGHFLFASAGDVSSLGMFICTDDPMDIGTLVTLHFSAKVTREEPLEVLAMVVWQTADDSRDGSPGMGVRFLHMSRVRRRVLMQMVAAISNE